ncbi:hypothetical protein BC831DRAFT_508540 [Entophlyctis helioformis]|nr:hypothetical protein BC831DRAFT_508540 [Entophlyctis helioformis]
MDALDFCLNGCGKSCSPGSMYCSSLCLHSAYAHDQLSSAMGSLSISPSGSSSGAIMRHALNASPSLPPSPALSAFGSNHIASPPSPFVLGAGSSSSSFSLEFRNRSHSHHHHHHHSHHHKRSSVAAPPPFIL